VAPLFVLGLLEFARGALVISLIALYGQFVAGFNLSIIGTAISLLYLLDNLFRLPAGWLTDRWGGKWLISAGIVISAFGIWLIYMHWNASFFILGAGLFGLGVAPVWPAVISGIAAKMPLHHIGEALSKVFIAWLVGAGAGMVIINYLIGYSYVIAFAILWLVLAIAMLLTILGNLPRVVPEINSSPSVFLKELSKELISLRILYPGMFVQTMSIGLMTPVIAIYARTVFGFSTEQFAYFLIGGGAFTVILLVPAGKLADRLGVKGPLIAGFSLASLGLLLLPMQKVVTHALLVGALIGIAYSLILPAWNGLMARVVSQEKMGTMWAVFMTIEGIGTAVGAYVGGKVGDSFGPQAPFLVSALVLAMMVVFYASGNIDKLIKEN
jgi:MFS family permease